MPPLRNSRLYSLHQNAGARFIEVHQRELLTNYGDPAAEHQAIRTTVGVSDPAFMSVTRVGGDGATAFLNRELRGMPETELPDGQGAHVFLTNGLGGILSDPLVYRRGGEYLILAWIDKNHTLFDVLHDRALGSPIEVTDASTGADVFSVDGPKSVELLTRLMPGDADAIAGLGRLTMQGARIEGPRGGVDVDVTRFSYSGEDGFHLVVPSADSPDVWTLLVDAARDLGGRPFGDDAAASTRVEAGLPFCGLEYSSNIVLDDLVQLHEDDPAPARTLVGLRAEAEIPGPLGTGLVISGDVPIGETTSIVHSPTFGQVLALAIVRADVVKPGEEVRVEVGETTHPFVVAELPFYSA